jgi:hypothetical protein
MLTKRWALASLAVFVVILVLEFVIHGVLLQGIYQQTAAVWRPQADMHRLAWLMWLGDLIFAAFFTLIYAYGYEKKKQGWEQGMRYGFYVGAMVASMQSLGNYVVMPIPGILAFYWFLAGMVEMLAAGIAVGMIYQGNSRSR